MADRSSDNKPLAVLIDAENVQLSVVSAVLDEIAKFGNVTVKRAYGDFTMPPLQPWRAAMLSLAIQPMQQFRNINGKSVTDSALIIDAMDLLHGGRVEGFCIVSSDSDFTRLVTRARENGLAVYGFGEKKTPLAFVNACTKFIYTEFLRPEAEPAVIATKVKVTRPKPPLGLLRTAIEAAEEETGWANLGAVGTAISDYHPDFDARTYGFAKLSSLIKASGIAEYRLAGEEGGPKQAFVKLREPSS